MFKVWYINHSYYGNNGKPFDTIPAALDYAKSNGFEAAIVKVNDGTVLGIVATWSPLNGTKLYED